MYNSRILRPVLAVLVWLFVPIFIAVPAKGAVDLLFEPELFYDPTGETLRIGEILEVDLIARSSHGAEHSIIGIDAILNWDPGALELLAVDRSHEGHEWLQSGFLPDPDNINEPVVDPAGGVPNNDGDAIYTAISQPDSPAVVRETVLVVTTLRFLIVGRGDTTIIAGCPPGPVAVLPDGCGTGCGTETGLMPSLGMFGQTRVLSPDTPSDITGDISGKAAVVINPPCPIPTVSAWGLVAMLLMFLTAATVFIRSRRMTSPK